MPLIRRKESLKKISFSFFWGGKKRGRENLKKIKESLKMIRCFNLVIFSSFWLNLK